MALITYEQAVKHLKQEGVLDVSPEDADLTLKIEQASALVITHLKRPGEWDVDSDPESDPEFAIVQAMTLKVLSHLYRYRGDDDDNEPSIEDLFRKMSSSMLRDPSLA